MSHDQHHHECCGGHHDHNPNEPVATDPATQSLSDALRVSFKLLSIIMVGVLVAFLATGFETIEPQEQGIVKVFGQKVGVVTKPGLVYNWPFPVGEIEKVVVKERVLELDDFWMKESPEEKTQGLLERAVSEGGLRVGLDGALLTGDRFLMHVKLVVRYLVKDPSAFRTQIGDLDQTVRSAVSTAAIKAAAIRTADGIQRTEQSAFLADTLSRANEELAYFFRPEQGQAQPIVVAAVELKDRTVPLAALRAYVDAQRARSEAQDRINAAKGEAEKTLQESAGPSYKLLVGEPHEMTADRGGSNESADLIGRYNRLRQAGRQAEAAATLAQIDEALLSSQTGGKASTVISEARSQNVATIEGVKARLRQFEGLLAEYNKSPRFMMERYWAAAREEILDSPTVEKFYLTTAGPKTVLRLNRDPEIRKEIRRELRKAEQDKAASAGKAAD